LIVLLSFVPMKVAFPCPVYIKLLLLHTDGPIILLLYMKVA